MLHSARLAAALCLALAIPGLAAAQDYTKWYLAEGSTGFFEEEILIGNPNAGAATVTITYLLPAGQPSQTKTITVNGFSRATVRVNDDIVAGSVSAKIDSNVPIVVERSMYWGGAQRRGGHNTTGVNEPKPEWFLAEGVSNAIFDQYILLANPNNVAVQVEITYLGSDGVKDVDTYTVAANSRRTIRALVDLDLPFGGKFRNRVFSARVKSLDPTAPIIVERAIYWGNIFVGGPESGGTNAAGITALSDTWRFAEGFAGAGFQTFVLLVNPSDQPVTVDTTFFLEDGTEEVDTRTINPNSRTNIWANAELLGRASREAFSILVKARNGAQIAAERAMYWGPFRGGIWREGHTVTGIPAEAPRWAFAEGLEDRFSGIEYDSFFLLNNATTTDSKVKATFLREDGRGFTHEFTIKARSRFTLWTQQFPQLSNQRFSVFFDSEQPIVAERATYWGPNYYGGHASAGVPWPLAFDFSGLQAPAAVTVTSASPDFGSTRGGTDVTIKGNNFAQGAQVLFGSTPAAGLAVLDAQTIVARTPPSGAGRVSITVQSGGAQATLANAFLYESPAPPPPPPTSGTQARGPAVAEFCDVAAPKTGAPSTAIYRTMCTGPTRTGALPLNFFGLVNQLAIERRGDLIGSCVKRGGNINFIVELVNRLRAATGTNRWGLNWKRGGEGISDDIVTYFYGPEGEEMEGDLRVYIIDVIGNHCPDAGNPGPNWQDQTNATRSGGTVGRWTTAGRF